MNEKIVNLDMLTKESVSVVRQKYVTVDGKNYTIGEPWRRAYVNSVQGRIEIQQEVEEPYLNAIIAMWGTTATVITTD